MAVLSALVLILEGTPAAGQTVVGTEPKTAQQQSEDQDVINPDRPGIADGSTVIGKGRVQLETGFQQEFRHADNAPDRTRFVPTLLRVGLSTRWEARFESNTFTQTATVDPEGVKNGTSGLAPVSLGVKFHMQDSAGLRHPSLGIIFRAFPASGTKSFHTPTATADLRLAADWDLTPKISLNPNAGVAFYDDDQNRRFAAGLVALTVNYFNQEKTINPFLDFGLQAPEASAAGSSFIVDAGIAYLPGRNVQVDFSVGDGPHGRTPPHRFISVGLSLRFHAS